MALEYTYYCKDCGKPFGYSHTSFIRDTKKGLSKPERCAIHRKQHSDEIRDLASSHFFLLPRKGKSSILGYPYLGMITRPGRSKPVAHEKTPDLSGVDIGLTEKEMRIIYEALQVNQILIIVAPTGSGKSTFIPSKLLFPLPPYSFDHFTNNGPIIITQPRISATLQIASSIAEKFSGCSVGSGFDVGYRYSDDQNNYDLNRNRMVIVTDGSLINWINEGKLNDFSMIVIDEAHERSANIDTILNLLFAELPKYPRLKLIIVSATIDSSGFVSFFELCAPTAFLDFGYCRKSVGYEEGPWLATNEMFDHLKIETNPTKIEAELTKHCKGLVERMVGQVMDILNDKSKEGSILGFLEGVGSIKDAVKQLSELLGAKSTIKVIAFHGEIEKKELDDILKDKSGRRRVIFATNTAETSLTVDDMIHVIDSGIIKESRWDTDTERKSLKVKFHSKAGCKQRWGRVGRTQKGFVYKLYSSELFLNYFTNYTVPAIQRTNMEMILLDAIAAGRNVRNFKMLTAPEQPEWDRALRVISARGILDKDGDFTDDGRETYLLAKMVGKIIDNSSAENNSTERALDVAQLLMLADRYACLTEAVTIICLMPHMGNAIFRKKDGLLIWDEDSDTLFLDQQMRAYESARAASIDDLDFGFKLYSYYEGGLLNYENSIQTEIGVLLKLRLDNFQEITIVRNALINTFRKGSSENSFRKLDSTLISKLRFLCNLAWKDKILTRRSSTDVFFEFEKGKKTTSISPFCAGNYKKDKQILPVVFDVEKVWETVDDKRNEILVGNFIIKCLPIANMANFLDIIESIKKYQQQVTMAELLQNQTIDLIVPVDTVVDLETIDRKKVVKALRYADTDAVGEIGYFRTLRHLEPVIVNIPEFELKAESSKDTHAVNLWTMNNGKMVAILEGFKPFDLELLKGLKMEDGIKAEVLRAVYNLVAGKKLNIIGFIVKINDMIYGLPIEHIFMERLDEITAAFKGTKILYKIANIRGTNIPVFGTILKTQKEREQLRKQKDLSGIVMRYSRGTGKIICRILYPGLETEHCAVCNLDLKGNDAQFIEIGGIIKIKLKSEISEISVQCSREVTVDEVDEMDENVSVIKQLLRVINADKLKSKLFNEAGIKIMGVSLVSQRLLEFSKLFEIAEEYPLLKKFIFELYRKSWELTAEVISIGKKEEQIQKGDINRKKKEDYLEIQRTGLAKVRSNYIANLNRVVNAKTARDIATFSEWAENDKLNEAKLVKKIADLERELANWTTLSQKKTRDR